MDIEYKSRKLQKHCNSLREAIREWGQQNGTLVARRLTELSAADSLADISLLPQARLHPLKGDRTGQFAVDVKDPFRLIFTPRHNPVPLLSDGGIDLSKVTKIKIIEIGDYHGD